MKNFFHYFLTFLIATILFQRISYSNSSSIDKIVNTNKEVTINSQPISKLINNLDSLMNSLLEEYHIPGAALILVSGDSMILSQGYGYSDLEQQTNTNPAKDVFRCGSVSKSFTATAIIQLAEKGKLKLSDPISLFLSPEEMNAFGIGERVITIHQLLTHSAGFDERLFGSHVGDSSDYLSLDKYFRKYPVNFRSEPGQILNYNDQGIALGGYIVEKISGKPFYKYVKEEIFDPLGMENSSFNPFLPSKIRSKLSHSYFFDENTYHAYNNDYILTYPAAGMVATPEDIGEFMIMHLNGGKPLLSNNSVQRMHRKQFSNHPKLRGWCYGFAEWYENNQRMIFKDGQATGFNSRLLLMPKDRWGFYLVWNRSIFDRGGAINKANQLKSRITSEILDILYPDTVNSILQKPKPWNGTNQPEFKGNYREMGIGINNWTKFLTIFLQGKVRKVGSHHWQILGGKYMRVDSLLFQWSEGHDFYAAFSKDAGSIKYLHLGTGSREKVPVFEQQIFQFIILSVLHVILLFVVIYSLILLKRNYKIYMIFFLLGSIMMFIGLPLFAGELFLVDFQQLYKGPTQLMILSSWLPFLGGIFLSIGIVSLFCQKEKQWFFYVGIAGLITIPYLIYWNFPIF